MIHLAVAIGAFAPFTVQSSEPGPSSHAVLHAAGAQFFLELPDLAQARAAYVGAPLTKLLADEDLVAAVAELTGEPFDPIASVQAGLAAALGDPALAEGILTLLDDLRAASFSFGGLEREPVAPEADEATGPQEPKPWEGLHARLVLEFGEADSAGLAVEHLVQLATSDATVWAATERGGTFSMTEPRLDLDCVRAGSRLALVLRTPGCDAGAPGAGLELERSLAGDEGYRGFAATVAATGAKTGAAPVWSGYSGLDRETVGRLFQRMGDDPPTDIEFGLLSAVFPFGQQAWSTALDGSTFRRKLARRASGPAQGVNEDFLAALPVDAIGAWALTFDAEHLLSSILEGASEEHSSDELLALTEEQCGLNPRTDLVDHLGSTLFLYMEPIQAIGPPKLRAYIELEDADAFAASLDTLATWLSEAFPDDVKVSRRDYRDVALTSFQVSALEELGMMQPTPTLAVLGGNLLVSLNATHAKREIKRLAQASDDESEGERAQHPLLAELEASGARGEAKLQSVGYVDWPTLIDGVYGLVKTAAGLFGGLGGSEMPDFSKLPPIEVVTRHFSSSTSLTTRTGDLVTTRSRSPFGPEVLALALGAGGSAVALQSSFGPDGGHIEASIGTTSGSSAKAEVTEVPGDVGADDTESDQTTREHMRVLRTGLAVYRMEQGESAPTLEALSTATESYPSGFVGGRTDVFLDGWGRAFRYTAAESGSTLYSLGADGADQLGEGDDVR